MKQILRFRGCYCPKRIQPICLFLLTASLLLGSGWHHAFGQGKYTLPDTITPLQIGDTIPEYLWHLPLEVVSHPDGRDTITLNDYRGKLILLDFWATWCNSCIAAMPKMHELQTQFGNGIVILPSTYEPADKAKSFLQTNSVTRDLNLTSIVDNILFTKVFQHQIIPHVVWINDKGQIGSTTTPAQVSASHILAMMEGKKGPMRTKQDLDTNRPFFLNHQLLTGNSILKHSILIRGWYDGLPSAPSIQKDSLGKQIGFSIANRSLLQIYDYFFNKLFLQTEQGFYNQKRRFIEVGNASPLVDGIYTFNLVGEELVTDRFYDNALNELNSCCGYHGSIERRTVGCYVLKRTGPMESLKTKGGKIENSLFRTQADKKGQLRNLGIHYLVLAINEQILGNDPLFLVDETGYRENIDISLSGHSDLELLVDELKTYNLEISREERQLDIFVIKQTDLLQPSHAANIK